MRPIMIILTAAALLFSGVAIAAPETGSQTATIDLSAIPGGPTIFLKCSRSDSLTNCGLVSIWQQSNGVPGLQITPVHYGGVQKPMDTPLLA